MAYLEYAKLLSNPCTGPLVHAPGSSEGGQVVRFESDFLMGNGATETAGFINVSPGAMNGLNPVAGGFGQGIIIGVGTSDTANTSLITNGANAYLPGYTFLNNNASSYRCVACCVQLYWPGSELNRSGIVSAAQGTYGLTVVGVTPTVASLRGISPVVERMPTECMEVKWAPNYSDGLFRNPGNQTTQPEDGHASLLLTWAGIPVSTGVRIRIVTVYEWRPKVTGLVLASNTAHSTAHSVQEVRQALDNRDASWWFRSGQAAANFLSGLTVAFRNNRGPSYTAPRIEL